MSDFFLSQLKRSCFCLLIFAFGQSAKACIGVEVIASDLNFSSYDSLNSISETSSFDIEVECLFDIALPLTFPLSYSVGVDSTYYGNNGLRSLKHDSIDYYLEYSLYRDVGLNQLLGPVTSSDLLTGTFDSLNGLVTHTLSGYGYMPGGQNVPAGYYSDMLVLTLEF